MTRLICSILLLLPSAYGLANNYHSVADIQINETENVSIRDNGSSVFTCNWYSSASTPQFRIIIDDDSNLLYLRLKSFTTDLLKKRKATFSFRDNDELSLFSLSRVKAKNVIELDLLEEEANCFVELELFQDSFDVKGKISCNGLFEYDSGFNIIHENMSLSASFTCPYTRS